VHPVRGRSGWDPSSAAPGSLVGRYWKHVVHLTGRPNLPSVQLCHQTLGKEGWGRKWAALPLRSMGNSGRTAAANLRHHVTDSTVLLASLRANREGVGCKSTASLAIRSTYLLPSPSLLATGSSLAISSSDLWAGVYFGSGSQPLLEFARANPLRPEYLRDGAV